MTPCVLQPYVGWGKKTTLAWYQTHHRIKHSRVNNFHEATFKNTIDSVAAIFVLLYIRFGKDALNHYQDVGMWHSSDDAFDYSANSLFQIKL